jgi:hypothetical protein
MRFGLKQLRARFSSAGVPTHAVGRSAEPQHIEKHVPKGADMIIAETTIATSVTASASLSPADLARKTAIMLVLNAAKSLGQATLASEPSPMGSTRATVRALEPERISVSLNVTSMGIDRLDTDRIRMIARVEIEVTTETPSCSRELVDAVLASVPNRIIKHVVVIRSPLPVISICAAEPIAWRELRAWRHARGA